ncbi:MAG: IPT/TIG domain-containing protein [Nitrospirota bacterium]
MRRIILVLLQVLLLGTLAAAHAATPVGGIIDTDTVWTAAGGPYLVTSDIVVDNSATLTVQAGAIVRFQPGVRLIVQFGSLRTLGTSASPVLFTSSQDVEGGSPAAGGWGGILFLNHTADAATILDYTNIRYGSTTTLQSSSPTFNNCVFENNAGFALAIDLSSYPHGTGNSAAGNGTDGIRVASGDMITSGAWDLKGIPYYLEGTVSVGVSPSVSGISPMHFEQGSTTSAVITGTRLSGAERVAFSNPHVTAAIQAGGTDTSIPVQITVGNAVPMGSAGFEVLVAAGTASLSPGITVIQPVPRITVLTPGRILVGQPDVTVEVSGSNFTSASVAVFDGAALATTFISSSKLSVVIPKQPLSGSKDLLVRNPDLANPGGFLSSNTITVPIELPVFAFSPDTLTLRQGESGTASVTISYPAPPGGLSVALTSTNPAILTVSATVTIPEGALSTPVAITAVSSGSTKNEIAEIHANQLNWMGGKVTVTARPQPTVNLVPTSITTGQSFTIFLTLALTDPAPAGGLQVTLSASTANIVTYPAAVSIPGGATQAQVTVNAINVGSTTITASGAGFISGDTSTITVRPIQTYNIGPMVSAPVGVMIPTPAPPPATKTVGPLQSARVGVVVGSAVTGLTPDRGSIGTQNLLVRVNGVGLATATGISFAPSTGISVVDGSFARAADGSFVEAIVSIAADAEVGDRVVVVATPAGSARPVASGADIFRVTRTLPEIWSLIPNYGLPGTTMALQVNGRNLQGATAISFLPEEGIEVSSSPTVSADGTLVTLSISVAPGAAPGTRTVRITTPAGTSDATLTFGNSFEVRAQTGAPYESLVSQQVGVMVPPPAPQPVQRSYGPFSSKPVGIAVGSTITAISPVSGAISTQGLPVRISGAGLSAADAISFAPAAGITVRAGTITAAADGSSLEFLIDIAADAPLGMRSVVVGAAKPASAGANIFRVTLPQPEVVGIDPLQREKGSSFTLTILGRNLASATRVNFSPAAGITVANPPTVNPEGTVATVNIILDAAAIPGDRVVTVTTPAGTTSDTASVTNTFTVTDLPGVTYSSLVSLPVGVTVEQPAPPSTVQAQYGPFVSREVVVFVAPAPVPTAPVPVTPVTSREVGVTVGAAVTGISPKHIEPGTTGTVTLSGVGFDTVNALQIAPADGIIMDSWSAAADGRSISITLTVPMGTSKGPRTITPLTPSGAIRPSSSMANILMVGPAPTITSIVPIVEAVGNTFTLTINGRDLAEAMEVRFTPSDGILVNNPPAVNAAGTIATVTIIIDGAAQGGERVVTITTPYGTSSSAASAANTFTVFRPTVRHISDDDAGYRFASDGPSGTMPLNSDGPGGDEQQQFLMSGSASMNGIKRSEMRLLHEQERTASSEAAYNAVHDIGINVNQKYYSFTIKFTGFRGPPEA